MCGPPAYAYNPAGELATLTYPSGRQVQQSYDGVGRLGQMQSADGVYLSVASTDYSAAGQVKHLLYGNGVVGDFTYNDHLQIASLRYSKPGAQWDMLNQSYDYGAGNNGQIQAIHVYNAPGAENSYSPQSYSYDAWGRLKTASTAGLEQSGAWRLEWEYDRLGNRRNQTLTGGNAPAPQPQLTISETSNRITDAGFAYDAAGNMTNDSLHTYAYDAENRIKTMDTSAATYSYVGALRVKKVSGGTTTVYVFSGSKAVAEYVGGALSKEYVYAGSQLLATVAAGGSRTYHHPDHLSIRSDSDANGNQTRSYGHFPFGETWYEDASQGKWKFTSYERDGESGLDYAMFRYDSSRLGRFMSPDPLAGSIANPQSLNRYSYVVNDPINLVDPLGLVIVFPPTPPPPGPAPYIGFDDGKGPFDCGYMGLPTNCGSHRPMSAELRGQGGGGGGPLESGLQAAREALQGVDCARLFNGEDPIAILDRLLNNDLIRVGDRYPQRTSKGGIKYRSFETNNIGAATMVATGTYPGPNGPISSYTITINVNGPYFTLSRINADKSTTSLADTSTFRGLTADQIQAVMLIHELAHVAGTIPSDSGKPNQSDDNSQTVREACFPQQ